MADTVNDESIWLDVLPCKICANVVTEAVWEKKRKRIISGTMEMFMKIILICPLYYKKTKFIKT